MDVERYLFDRLAGALKGVPLDRDRLRAGISAFARDNGFAQLEGRFSDSVIRDLLDGSVDSVLACFGRDAGLYFSCYQMIEEIRLLNNRTLELANERRQTGRVEMGEVEKAETDFDEKMAEIGAVEGLYPMLSVQISEIISNIDYAKGVSPLMGKRLHDMAGGDE